MSFGKWYVTIFLSVNWVKIMSKSVINNSCERSESEHGKNPLQGAQHKPYQKPVLVVYGDVRDVTLGPSLGIGESGNAGTRCDKANIPDNCFG